MKLSGLPLLAFLATASAQSLRQGDRETRSITGDPFEPGAGGCECRSDYDCQKPVCEFDHYSGVGTCVAGSPGPPVPSPTAPPVAPTACCPDPKTIPTKCEVLLLINLLDIAVSSDHKLAAQWLRLSFHDAGTFNTVTHEGGANGCLMTDPDFRLQPENGFLDIPINALEAIKNNWEAHPDTCVQISAADIIQFAGRFASIRQMDAPGITPSKINALISEFQWGRKDESDCELHWVDNLPGFSLGSPPGNIALRCLNAGKEIKVKMMERNGFTAEESAALIGAHTIGLTRNSFGTGLANPWVANGDDNATPDGPIFDNEFHNYLKTEIVENSVPAFAGNTNNFDVTFPDWFMDNASGGLNHLDTDVALAFPSMNPTIHPDFHTFTAAFAANNGLFLKTFLAAMDKMSRLGVDEILESPGPCTPCDGDGEITVDEVLGLVKDLGTADADAEDKLRLQQESREITAARESDGTPLRENELLSVDDALMQLEMQLELLGDERGDEIKKSLDQKRGGRRRKE